MKSSSFWSRLLPVLLISALALTFAVTRQGSAVVQAGLLEQVPAGTDATTHVLSYQGRLADPATGAPKADGSYSMTFRIYNAATGGTILWTEIKDVAVSKGLFSTLLGDTTALPSTTFDGNDRWLGVKVGGDTETTPRMRMAFAPYASYALNGGKLGGQDSAFYRNANNINAGTLNDARIPAGITRDSEVMGIVKAGDGAGSTVDADLLDAQDSAFYRNASNINAGTLADARIPATIARNSEVVDVTGDVMSGADANTILTVKQTGTGSAVEASADTGKGIVGSSTSDNGVFGTSTNSWAVRGDGQYGGIYGYATSPGSDAIRGNNTATSGSSWGVVGTGVSPDGRGVAGFNSATTGVAEGVYGYSSSTVGRGVSGYAATSTGSNSGVYGESNSTSGRGVYGTSPYMGVWGQANRYGVYGRADDINSSYGVYGSVASGGTGYAGYFNGNVRVAGTLSKGGGSFMIDHPLDPENKYLYHSFVESPDMMNVYNGNVTLDGSGAAWVDLPAYFQALNRDFRYQLTAIGGPGPNLYIAQQVQDNRFQIAGGDPGLQVSWQVTGIRQDAFANANRIVVEEDKPADERGTLLYPEALGRDRSLGLDFQRNAALSFEPVQAPSSRTSGSDKPLGGDPSQAQP